jgi:TP901 family phage tail tape measure protein
MSNFDVSILLRLVDHLTAPARQAAASMKQLGASVRTAATTVAGASRGMERPFVNALSRMNRAATEFSIRVRKAFRDIANGPGAALNEMGGKLNAMRWQMMTTMFFAAPLAVPFRAAAQNELGLARLGQTAGWKEDEFSAMMDDRNQKIRKIAKDSRQASSDLLAVYTDMVAQGMAEPEALRGLESLGKVMTATGMAAEDASALGFALRKQFNIDPSRWLDVIGKLHKAGKLGGFELKDMARWFPEMGAMTSMMGMGGEEFAARLAAGLQLVREGAADPNAAGNNMVNLLQKMFQKETRTQFKKAMGIDLAKELNKTVKAGGDPILRTVQLAQKYMDKTKNAFLTGNLFADRQALLGLLPLLEDGLDRWKQISKLVQGADREEILRDERTTVKTLWGEWRRLGNAVEWFSDTVVKSVLGDAGETVGFFADQFDKLNAFGRENKPLMRTLVLGFAGLVAAALGIRTLLFIFNSFRYAALALWGALRFVLAPLLALNKIAGPGGLVGAMGRLAGAFRMLGGALLVGGALSRLGLVRGALVGIGIAIRGLLFGPIGLLAGALLMLVPDGWWTKAGELLTQGFEIIKGIVKSSVETVRGWIVSIFDAFSDAASRVKQFAQDTFGNMQLPSAPIMVPPGLQPGQTIPGIMNNAAPQLQQQNNNRTINNSVTVPITINATVSNTTPQGIAGAVAGAGQSVAGEVKKALSDGGQ